MRDIQQAQTFGAAEFRKAMGLFATGVCVVSVETDNRTLAAMTINSFVSVSLEPMLVSWSLHNSSSQYEIFAEAQEFSVSILGQGQGKLALRYAARADSLLDAQDFSRSAGGMPVIAGSLAHFECRHWAAHAAGDHTMILGEVGGISPVHPDGGSASPLGFFGGQFCSIGQ